MQALFVPPIEQRVSAPPREGAFVRRICLHGAAPVVRLLYASRLAEMARARAASIVDAQRRYERSGTEGGVTVGYRQVLELWVDGVCEGRWVGQIDDRGVGVVAMPYMLTLAKWPAPPPAGDPAWMTTPPPRAA